MDAGPLPEMPCWDELRAGCLMSFCEGDSGPGNGSAPRCYCDHQIRVAAEAFAETVTRTDRLITSLVIGGVTATEEPGRVTMLARADLAELNRLPRARRPGPWWRRLLLRVIRYLASHRRVV
jgi:hypothetical protein